MKQIVMITMLFMCLANVRLAYCAGNQPHPCELETAPLMTQKSSWPELYMAAVALPPKCFDGGFAEGISETLARKMNQDWYGFLSILEAHPKDTIFIKWVLRSINATLDPKDIRSVEQLASNSCEKSLEKQCLAISAQAAAAIKGIN